MKGSATTDIFDTIIYNEKYRKNEQRSIISVPKNEYYVVPICKIK